MTPIKAVTSIPHIAAQEEVALAVRGSYNPKDVLGATLAEKGVTKHSFHVPARVDGRETTLEVQYENSHRESKRFLPPLVLLPRWPPACSLRALLPEAKALG